MQSQEFFISEFGSTTEESLLDEVVNGVVLHITIGRLATLTSDFYDDVGRYVVQVLRSR